MRILNFKVDAQTLSTDGDFSNLVAGTSDYLEAKFSFSGEWWGCNIVASFFYLGNEYPAMLVDGECRIPEEALKGRCFYVEITGRRGEYKIRTNRIKVKQEVN